MTVRETFDAAQAAAFAIYREAVEANRTNRLLDEAARTKARNTAYEEYQITVRKAWGAYLKER